MIDLVVGSETETETTYFVNYKHYSISDQLYFDEQKEFSSRKKASKWLAGVSELYTRRNLPWYKDFVVYAVTVSKTFDTKIIDLEKWVTGD